MTDDQREPNPSPALELRIERLDGPGAHAAVGALADVLIDCVEGGASVSFMLPISRATAVGFWTKVAEGTAMGSTILLVASDTRGIVGTVHLQLALPENQPHRAEVAKLLVHRRARRQGVAEALMLAVEVAARSAGRTLVVLDTVTGDAAERLYERLGWQRAGVIPNYALYPDGRPCATTIFWKAIPAAGS